MDTFDQLVNMLRKQAQAGILPEHIADMEITPDMKLGDLGIDSLGKMGLLSGLMEISDQYFSDDTFHDEQTLQEIVNIISTQPNNG